MQRPDRAIILIRKCDGRAKRYNLVNKNEQMANYKTTPTPTKSTTYTLFKRSPSQAIEQQRLARSFKNMGGIPQTVPIRELQTKPNLHGPRKRNPNLHLRRLPIRPSVVRNQRQTLRPNLRRRTIRIRIQRPLVRRTLVNRAAMLQDRDAFEQRRLMLNLERLQRLRIHHNRNLRKIRRRSILVEPFHAIHDRPALHGHAPEVFFHARI